MKKRVLSFILCLVLCLSFMPMAFADDFSPTEILDVTISGVETMVVGGKPTWLNETPTVPAGAHYSASYSRLYNLSYGNTWGADNEITPGYYDLEVHFTPETGYSFPSNVTNVVNADITEMTFDRYECSKIGVDKDKLCVHYYMVVGDGLYWEKTDGVYSIPQSRTGKAIQPLSLSTVWAHGGTAPYTFSKKSGPSWITVSPDGTVSGTPYAAADATVLEVAISDGGGKFTTFYIKVGSVYSDGTSIAAITELSATVSAPVVGATPDKAATTVGGYYTAEVTLWGTLDESGNFGSVPEMFEAGKTYAAVVRFVPVEGIQLSAEATATINGLSGVFWSYEPSTGAVNYRVDFSLSTDPTTTTTAAEPSEVSADVMLGDVNGDKSIDMKDVLVMRKAIANMGDAVDAATADVNGDKSVDMKDVLMLRKYIANMIDKLG